MDKEGYFLLIPAIIYGAAIVDLLKIFNHKKNYIEMVGWGIYVMLVVIFTWSEFYEKLHLITDNTSNFLIFIVQAILIARMANVITPEANDTDTKKHFFDNRREFFILASVAIIYSIGLSYFVYEDKLPTWIRLLAIGLFMTAAFSKRFWLRVSALALTLTFSFLVIFGLLI